MPSPVARPAGIEKRAIARRKPSGRHGPLDGASASRKAGMPMVKVEVSVNWRGSIGKTPLVIAIPSGVFPMLPRQFTLTSTFTIGIPAFLLALAPSSGPWRPEGFLRAIARFSGPAGLATGIGILTTYLLARHAFGVELIEARSATAATVVVSGLAIVFALEDQPGTRRLVVGALCATMALLFFGACAIPAARHFFEIATPTGDMVLAWLIGSAVAIVLLVGALRVVAMLERRAGGV